MRKRRTLTILGALAAVWILAFLSTRFVFPGGEDVRSGSGRDVVMMRCNTSDSTFGATAYKGSSGTPSRRSDNCAENVSQLLKDGFAIRDIGHYDREKSGYVVITLVR